MMREENSLKRSALTPLLLLLLALPACSDDDVVPSTDSTPITDAGDDTSSAGDAAPGDLDTTCPSQAPATGSPCTTAGLRCGYGDDPRCGMILECLGESWVVAFELDCGGVSGTCPAAQPASFCPTEVGAVCRYDATLCSCQAVCSGRRPPPGEEYRWSCAPPPTAACPKAAPTDTTVCEREGLVCTYGYCGVITATCTEGKWALVEIGPPPSQP